MPRNNTKKTTEQFIADARRIHGELYSYDKCAYEGAHEKLIVVCREHGPFQISANSHLQGSGCQSCRGGVRLTDQQYLARARVVHGKRYKYGTFNGLRSPIEIQCTHGKTSINASRHLLGAGCPKCRDEDRLQRFISAARKVHGERYDYSKCRFEHCDKKVQIICTVHGPFQQTPHNHLHNHGCPKCARRS